MKKFLLLFVWLICAGVGIAQKNSTYSFLNNPYRSSEVFATYSIVGWDSVTGDFGVAVQSKFLGVGAVVPYAKAGIGAVASQAWVNTTFGPRGLEMLLSGMSAQQVVESLIQSDSDANRRQVGIVDARGGSYAYTGSACQRVCGHVVGRGYSVQGNNLASEDVAKAMSRVFEMTEGGLAEKLLAALEAGEKAGGDKHGWQSAALLVVRDQCGYSGYSDRFVDLRVDSDSMPLVALRRLYNLWERTFLADARMRSIEVFNKKKNFSAAQLELRRVVDALNSEVRAKPDDPDVLNHVAWTLATNAIDRERALEYAKRAAKLAPGKLEILNTMAECHYNLGHYDEAIAIEAELVTKEPANDNFWKQLQKFREAKQKSGR